MSSGFETAYVFLRFATKRPKSMNDKGFVEILVIVRAAFHKLARNLIKVSQAAFPAFHLKGD